MRLYGLLERLTKLKLFNTKEVSIEPAAQSGATDKIVNIPNLGANATQEMVLDLQQQTLANKTLTSPVVGGTATFPGAGNVNLASAVNSLLITGQSGSTATISTASLSGAKTFTLPDNSGNIVTTGDNGSVTSTMIANGTIKDEDISSAPADRIAGSKVSPDFVAQNVVTTGSITGGSIVVSGNTLGTGIGNSLNIGDANDEIAVPGNFTVSGNLTVNGTTTTVSTTNLLVEDKLVTLNDGGLAASGGGTGIEVEEDNVVTGYAKVTSDRNGWELKAPNSANVVTIPNSVAAGDVVLTAGTQSIAGLKTFSDNVTLSSTGSLKLPVGTDVQRPTGVQGMVRYNSDQNSFEGYDGTTWSGLGGGGTTDRITQANSFNVGDVVYLNGSTYTAAIATAANTAEVAGVVSKIVTAGTVFEITLVGEVSGLVAARFDEGTLPAVGEVVFLSPTNPGKLTITEPSVVGQVSVPVGIVASSIAGPAVTVYVQPKRGVVVGAANARTTIAVDNAAATSVVDVTNYNSLKLEGELFVSRVSGNQRAYYTVEAAKNGAGTWQVSASYTGDDILYTTLPSWDVSGTQLQLTMPNVTGTFLSASLTYSLNAPAVGASLPLAIDSSALNIVAEAPLSYRNRIINGDMRIDQRNSGAAVVVSSGANFFTADRWIHSNNGAGGTQTAQRIVNTDAVSGYSLRITATASPTNTTLGNYWLGFQQKIEGFNAADFRGKNITLSFSFKAKINGTYPVAIRAGDFSQSYVTTIAYTGSESLQYFSITLPIPSNGVLTNLTNSTGMDVTIGFVNTGTLRTSTLNAWQSGNFLCTSSDTAWWTTAGNYIELTDVQLEVGSKASAFERRPYGMELALCQRYYEKQSAKTYASYTPGSVDSVLYGSWSAEKRVSPNLSVSATTQINTVAVGAVATKSWIAGLSSGGAPGICAATITAEAEL